MEEDWLKRRRLRQRSKREGEWIERLIERYGDGVRDMSRDKGLNSMKQTEGDLKGRN
jgi:nucleolar protein 16